MVSILTESHPPKKVSCHVVKSNVKQLLLCDLVCYSAGSCCFGIAHSPPRHSAGLWHSNDDWLLLTFSQLQAVCTHSQWALSSTVSIHRATSHSITLSKPQQSSRSAAERNQVYQQTRWSCGSWLVQTAAMTLQKRKLKVLIKNHFWNFAGAQFLWIINKVF